MPRRGEIWLADLSPGPGTEPGKTWPVLIVQADVLLEVDHPSTLTIPLTTRLIEDAEPLRIRVRASGLLKRDSDLLIDQLRTIDNRRLTRRALTKLDHALMTRIEGAIAEVLDLSAPKMDL